MNAKARDIYGLDGPFLEDELRDYGLRPEDIDIVLNTHLHFDHCGGNTRVEKDKVVPAFPNARYIVQRGEFEHAMNPNERDRASYFPENYVPIEAAGMFSLLEEDGDDRAGRRSDSRSRAHRSHAVREAHRRRQDGVLFADLVPTTAHLPIPWIMGYDLYPMTTLENKKRWIPEVIREGWLALFAHDARCPAAYLARAQRPMGS